MQIEPDTTSKGVFIPDMRAGPGGIQELLRQYLQENAIPLFEIIRTYVIRVRLAHGEAVQAAAYDILHDAVIEALAHADRFDPTTQPRAWLLSIAANILKRKRAEATKLQQHEFLLSDLAGGFGAISESDFFDQLAMLSSPSPEQAVETHQQVLEILSRASTNDQHVLYLALLHDLDSRRLAQVLGISPGTARVRLHRALNRLRIAWSNPPEQQEYKKEVNEK
jgi:RNA polymerase sigma factor (sigma-70 family)